MRRISLNRSVLQPNLYSMLRIWQTNCGVQLFSCVSQSASVEENTIPTRLCPKLLEHTMQSMLKRFISNPRWTSHRLSNQSCFHWFGRFKLHKRTDLSHDPKQIKCRSGRNTTLDTLLVCPSIDDPMSPMSWNSAGEQSCHLGTKTWGIFITKCHRKL